jgi:hypothetical protein
MKSTYWTIKRKCPSCEGDLITNGTGIRCKCGYEENKYGERIKKGKENNITLYHAIFQAAQDKAEELGITITLQAVKLQPKDEEILSCDAEIHLEIIINNKRIIRMFFSAEQEPDAIYEYIQENIRIAIESDTIFLRKNCALVLDPLIS